MDIDIQKFEHIDLWNSIIMKKIMHNSQTKHENIDKKFRNLLVVWI